MKNREVDAIIFDMDGVLIYSEHIRFNIFKNIFIRRGLDFSKHTLQSFMGKSTKNLIQTLADDVQMAEELFEEYELTKPKNIAEHVTPIEMTVDFIKTYKGTSSLAIASNSPRTSIESILRHLGIYERFAAITSRNDVTQHKPHPEVYVKTATQLHVDPRKCLVVEDSIIGAKAAIDAGMQCYILLQQYNAREEFTDMAVAGFISSKEELMKVSKGEFLL